MRETAETREARERRLKIRCWRRGTKEMDLILGGFFDAYGAGLSEPELDAFEALTQEDDTELYRWITGAAQGPVSHQPMIDRLRRERGLV